MSYTMMAQYPRIERFRKWLHALTHSVGLRNPSQQSQDEVQVLGRKCADTAQELISLLQQLEMKGKRNLLQVASKAIKNVEKKSKVVGLQQKLDDYRRLIDSRILVDLRQRIDLIAVQQDDSF